MTKLIKWTNLVTFVNTLITVFVLVIIFQACLAFYLFTLEQTRTLVVFGYKYIEIFSDTQRLEFKMDFTPSIILTPIISLVLIIPIIFLVDKLKQYANIK